MSRIGKKPVELPAGVKASVKDRLVTIEASGKKLSITHRPEVTVTIDAGKHVLVERNTDTREARALHGLTRALINNMVIGVTKGYTKELEINGVGWSAAIKGKVLAMKVGYADSKDVVIPDGVKVEVKGNRITVTGTDKASVGDFAAQVRAQRKPEPYNGKGVKYLDEVIARKQGKQFAGGSS